MKLRRLIIPVGLTLGCLAIVPEARAQDVEDFGNRLDTIRVLLKIPAMAAAVMQLVEKGELNLDSPVTRYGVDLGNPAITVRNLLTHTSEEVPGSWYSYNGSRFGQLGP